MAPTKKTTKKATSKRVVKTPKRGAPKIAKKNNPKKTTTAK